MPWPRRGEREGLIAELVKRRHKIDHDFTIHFKKPAGWSDTVFIHYFEKRPGGLAPPGPACR